MNKRYRFFRTNFWDDEHRCPTFEINIFKVGRRDGFITTGSIHSLRQKKDRNKGGWYCMGTLNEQRKNQPEMREIKQSTARKLLRRCPIRFYEGIAKNKPCISRAELIAELKKIRARS